MKKKRREQKKRFFFRFEKKKSLKKKYIYIWKQIFDKISILKKYIYILFETFSIFENKMIFKIFKISDFQILGLVTGCLTTPYFRFVMWSHGINWFSETYFVKCFFFLQKVDFCCQKKNEILFCLMKSSDVTFVYYYYSGPCLFIPFFLKVFWDAKKMLNFPMSKKKCLNLCFQKNKFSKTNSTKCILHYILLPRCSYWQISRIKWFSGNFQKK